MTENGRAASSTAKELTSSPMETRMSASMRAGNRAAREPTYGKEGRSTKASLRTG